MPGEEEENPFPAGIELDDAIPLFAAPIDLAREEWREFLYGKHQCRLLRQTQALEQI